MGITTDFYKDEFVHVAVRNARANMLPGQLDTKFGSPPKRVDEPLAGASDRAMVEKDRHRRNTRKRALQEVNPLL